MSELVDALRRELARLEAELRADPRSIKIAHIKELLTAYEKERPTSAPESTPTPERQHPRTNGSGMTKAAMMEESIVGLLRNGQMHRGRILDHLKSLGIMGHEKNPMNDLAGFLSAHRDRFVSDGNGNFRLAK